MVWMVAAMADEDLAIADLPPYSPPAPETELLPAAAQRAKALALFYKGRRLEKELDDDLALEAYTAAMKIEPHNVSLASRMATLMANMGKYTEALALLEKSLSQNETDPDSWITLSRYCLKNHHDSDEIKAKALQYAKQAVDKFPLEASVYRHLVDAYLILKDLPGNDPRERAREVMERAKASASTDPAYWLGLITSARKVWPLDDKSTKEAHLAHIVSFAEKAEQFAKEDAAIWEAIANFYIDYASSLKSLSMIKKALPLLEKITQKHPENLPARRKLANTLRQTGETERATKIYQDLIRINAQDLDSHRALLRFAESKGDAAAIISHRLEILRWEGGTALDWLSLSDAMMKQSQFTETISLLKRARQTHREDARVVFQTAIVHRAQQQWEEAFAATQAAIQLAEKFHDPKKHAHNVSLLKNPDFYYTAAGIATRVPSQTELAATWYRKSLELAPKDKPALIARCYNDLGYLWLERNEKIDEAGELIRTAVQLVPDQPGYLDSLGWFHFKKQDYQTALTHLEKAAALSKKADPEILLHLAQTLWELQQPEAAIAALEAASKLPKAPAQASELLTRYRSASTP
jgi:tetratricopeptide (TPR) repeat protein